MDWIVGKVVFPTIVPHFSPLPPSAKTLAAIEASYAGLVSEAPSVDALFSFPCGWDERDALV